MPPALLIVKDVNKTYDGFKAITNLNFTLAEGELRTVIGPNGAGKSTFFDLITGRARPDTGQIKFGESIDLTKLKEYQINRLGIGRKFQTPSVFAEHSVWDNLILSLKGPRSVFATLIYRLSSEDRDRLDELLRLIGLYAKREWTADQLSHGEKQWLEIGMLLATNPKLLLVDEPAAGMSDEETHKTGELLLSLATTTSPSSTRAACSARANSTRCRPTRRSVKSISAAANTATDENNPTSTRTPQKL